MIVHHITHEILNNIVIITKVRQVIAFPCRLLLLLKKVQFCLQQFEIKNENVDCEVFKKPNVMKFTPRDTGVLPRSNLYDQLEVQFLNLT